MVNISVYATVRGRGEILYDDDDRLTHVARGLRSTPQLRVEASRPTVASETDNDSEETEVDKMDTAEPPTLSLSTSGSDDGDDDDDDDDDDDEDEDEDDDDDMSSSSSSWLRDEEVRVASIYVSCMWRVDKHVRTMAFLCTECRCWRAGVVTPSWPADCPFACRLVKNCTCGDPCDICALRECVCPLASRRTRVEPSVRTILGQSYARVFACVLDDALAAIDDDDDDDNEVPWRAKQLSVAKARDAYEKVVRHRVIPDDFRIVFEAAVRFRCGVMPRKRRQARAAPPPPPPPVVDERAAAVACDYCHVWRIIRPEQAEALRRDDSAFTCRECCTPCDCCLEYPCACICPSCGELELPGPCGCEQ